MTPVVSYFAKDAVLQPRPPKQGIFDGLVLGKNAASFRRVEEIVNDCRTKGLVSNLALVGVPSSGKTTTAQIIAGALERPFYEGSALNFDGKPHQAFLEILESVFGAYPGWALKVEYLGAQQISTVKPCVIFLDEAHDLPPKAQSLLLQLMERPYRVNINGVLVDGSQIMWIFGTTDFSLLQVPLQTRTTAIPFVGYTLDEIAQMVMHRKPQFTFEEALAIAKAAKAYPRQAFKIADFIADRDLSEGVQAALSKWYEVDENGLDQFDQLILSTLRNQRAHSTPRRIREAQDLIADHAAGRRVGATALRRAQSFLASLNEPAPISQGSLGEKLQYTDQADLFRRIVYLESLNLLVRTPRGPMAVI